MNLLDKRFGLLFTAALLFFSCEEEVRELNITPENNLGIFFEEVSLEGKINQVWAGGVPSSFTGNLLAGSIQDSTLGEVEATLFGDISPERIITDTSTIRTAIIQDLTLNLRLTGVSGIFEENDIQNLSLFRLQDPIDAVDDINSATELQTDILIGEASFNIFQDSIGLVNNGNGDPSEFDANGVYKYLIPFNLTDDYKNFFMEAFIQSIISGSPQSDDDIDSVNFYLDQNLKGLAVIPGDNMNVILNFDITNGLNYDFDLTYEITNSNQETEERIANFQINSLKSFSNISPNDNIPWTGGVLNGINETNEILNLNLDNIYIHSGTNLLGAIDLSSFIIFTDTISNVILTQATLSIDNVSILSSSFPRTTSLNVTFSNDEGISNGIISDLSNNLFLSELPTSILYDTLNDSFDIQMPLYIQGIVNGDTDLSQIIIGSDLISNDFTVGNDISLNGFSFRKEDVSLSYFYSRVN